MPGGVQFNINQSDYNIEITDTEIIMGSIRSGIDIVDAQLAGAHIVTAGLPHYLKMSEHPGTTSSVDQFMTDFKEWLA